MVKWLQRSFSTAGVPSSRLGRSLWTSWCTNWSRSRFFSAFSRFPLHQKISFHRFLFIISSIFTQHLPLAVESGLVNREPCLSYIVIKGLHINRATFERNSSLEIIEDLERETHLIYRRNTWYIMNKISMQMIDLFLKLSLTT